MAQVQECSFWLQISGDAIEQVGAMPGVLRAEQWTPWHCKVLWFPSSVLKSYIFSGSSGEWDIKYPEAFSACCEVQVIFGLWMQQSLKCIWFPTCKTLHTFSNRDTHGKVQGVTHVWYLESVLIASASFLHLFERWFLILCFCILLSLAPDRFTVR